jgi:hypothetical protein
MKDGVRGERFGEAGGARWAWGPIMRSVLAAEQHCHERGVTLRHDGYFPSAVDDKPALEKIGESCSSGV